MSPYCAKTRTMATTERQTKAHLSPHAWGKNDPRLFPCGGQHLCRSLSAARPKWQRAGTVARPSTLFEGDLVDRLLNLVDDHVGELGALLAVQSLT